MAETADTNRVSLYYSIETTWNETPGSPPTMNELPFVSDTLAHIKTTVVPTTIRPDRMQEAIVRVGDEASGDVNIEFRHAIYDDLIACTLGSTPVVVNLAPTDLVVTSPSTMAITLLNFVTAGIVPGMNIRVSGRTNPANNGIFTVATVAATTLTVTQTTLVTEGSGTATIAGKMMRNGTQKRSVLIEKRWNDIGEYEPFYGMRLGQMNLSLTSRQLVTGSFSFMGARGPIQAVTVAGSSVVAPTKSVYDASNNVGEIFEAGTAFLTPVTSIQLSLLANLRSKPAVANRFPIDIGLGTFEVTGTMEAYFENSDMWQKFFNHTQTSLKFRLTDASSNTVLVTIPSLYFSEGAIPTPGQNQDVFLSLPLRGAYNSANGYVIQIDSL